MRRPVARVTVPELGGGVDTMWQVLLDLTTVRGASWTLIGGQMVLLHALEHGTLPAVVSQDGDALADVRAQPGTLAALTARLRERGFVAVQAPGPAAARAHRFELDAPVTPVVIDLLAPDGLGARTDLTTERPGRTIQVPGGTQAINRSEPVLVTHLGRSATVLRPSLLGAIVGKAAACALPHGSTERHYRDLALLATLVREPAAMARDLDGKDRARLAKAADVLDERHAWAWNALDGDRRAAGRFALRTLLRPADRPRRR